MKQIAQNVTLSVISLIVTALLLEGVSRIFFLHSGTHVEDLYGKLTSMQLAPGQPERGLRPRFQGRMRSGEFDVQINLNDVGFRSPIVSDTKQEGEPLNITLLGDSFMFGWGVEVEDSFGSYLAGELSERLGTRVVVTNLAVPGVGQATQLKYLRRCEAAEPDIIICGLYVANHVCSGNDLIDNLNEQHQQASAGQDEEPAQVDPLRRLRRFFKAHSNLYRLIEARLGSILLSKFSGAIEISEDPRILDNAWKITEGLLLQIQEEARKKDASFVLQYVPNMLDAARSNNKVYEKLLKLAGEHNLLIAPNPVSIFQDHKADFAIGDYYYPVDGHWTYEAHRLCAQAMANFICDLNIDSIMFSQNTR